MTAERKAMMELQELVRLYRMGTGYREIARLLRMSPNTERAYRDVLRGSGLLDGSPAELPCVAEIAAVLATAPRPSPASQVSSAEPWRDRVKALWDRGVGPQAIWDRLRVEEPGFSASLSAVKRMCLAFRRALPVRPEDVVIPVDTEAGDVAQVDFGYVDELLDPETHVVRKAWAFVLVLGFSRQMWADIVFDQSASTWVRLHVDAFNALGGVPRTLVPDNLKAAVIKAAFGADRDQLALQRTYRELARHYGFRIDPAPPRAPEKKGKVESGVKYLKHNFMAGRTELELATVRRDLTTWLTQVASQRIHGTTGKRPQQVFDETERAALLALPAEPFRVVVWRQARVHPDAHIAIDRVLYSVPFIHIHKTAWVRVGEHRVTIYIDDARVADHDRRERGRSTYDEHLPSERADLRHRSEAYWVARAGKIHADVELYVREVFASDDVVSQLRVVQAIVTHLEEFPTARAAAACRRAQEYGNYTYRGVRRILRKALDLEPRSTTEPEHGRLDSPRFARDPRDFSRYPTGGSA